MTDKNLIIYIMDTHFVKTECTYFCESTSLQAGSYFLTL